MTLISPTGNLLTAAKLLYVGDILAHRIATGKSLSRSHRAYAEQFR